MGPLLALAIQGVAMYATPERVNAGIAKMKAAFVPKQQAQTTQVADAFVGLAALVEGTHHLMDPASKAKTNAALAKVVDSLKKHDALADDLMKKLETGE